MLPQPRILSASRRTDLPAFYSEWFLNRVREGWCAVPNPYNSKQVARVSLSPRDVDAVVFWTRWPRPLLARLDELEALGLPNYVFLFTLLDYPQAMEPHLPPLRDRLDVFRELAGRLGPKRVTWRYDPIVYSDVTDEDWHVRTFERLARELEGCTDRCIISTLAFYKKNRWRLRELARDGILVRESPADPPMELFGRMAEIAETRGISVQNCSQIPVNRGGMPVWSKPCIDNVRLNELFGLSLPSGYDPSQRTLCRCAKARDIGMYDSCVFGCKYCYANDRLAQSRANLAAHDLQSPSMLGHVEPPPEQGTLPL